MALSVTSTTSVFVKLKMLFVSQVLTGQCLWFPGNTTGWHCQVTVTTATSMSVKLKMHFVGVGADFGHHLWFPANTWLALVHSTLSLSVKFKKNFLL